MATVTSYDPALKQIYRSELLEFLTYTMRPMMGALPKYEDFGGRNMPIPLCYGNTQGRSHNFQNAQANVTDSSLEDFLLTRIENHSLAHVSSEVAAATINQKHAFIAALKKEVDSAFQSLADAIESEMPLAGSGELGTISSGSTVSNQTITLADIHDVTRFEVGMTLVAAASATGSTRSGSEVLAGVNRSTGVLTATSAQWDTVITAIATGDSLFVQGDAQNGGSSPVGLSGFIRWLPASAPSGGESYFGVDRSVDSRLYGTYHNGSSQSIEEALIDAQSKAAREGGKPDVCFLNHAQYRKLTKELGSKKEYSELSARGGGGMVAHIAYKGVVLEGDHGPIKVVAANKCQSAIAWILQSSTWTLASLGKLTRFDDIDGNTILRRASASGVEARTVSWANLGCNGPIYNVHCALPAA